MLPHVVTSRRLPILLALFVALAAASLGALAAAAPASAATPCWKRLINDWYDGRIDNVYPVKCYRDAIKHLPPDVEAYSDARDAIERALLGAIKQKQSQGENVGPDTRVPAQPQTDTTDTTPGAGSGNGDGNPPGSAAGDPDPEGGGGGIGDVLKPANADSIPIPLLVLAGLALLLLAAASAGFVARRLQARRVRVSDAPRDPRQP